MGRLLSEGGRFKDAEPFFQAALRVDPDDHVTLTGYGRALIELGDVEYAVRCFQKAGVQLSLNAPFSSDKLSRRVRPAPSTLNS
jgi:tetratricopeptide (TPR) repeat protein